jgi:hypothetical protein
MANSDIRRELTHIGVSRILWVFDRILSHVVNRSFRETESLIRRSISAWDGIPKRMRLLILYGGPISTGKEDY